MMTLAGMRQTVMVMQETFSVVLTLELLVSFLEMALFVSNFFSVV